MIRIIENLFNTEIIASFHIIPRVTMVPQVILRIRTNPEIGARTANEWHCQRWFSSGATMVAAWLSLDCCSYQRMKSILLSTIDCSTLFGRRSFQSIQPVSCQITALQVTEFPIDTYGERRKDCFVVFSLVVESSYFVEWFFFDPLILLQIHS